MYTTFYIVRHGETDWNAKGLLQGHVNTKLNATGKSQAKQLAKAIQHIHFDAVFSSDLTRALETAHLIAQERNLAITTAKALREKSYGSYEGLTHQEARRALANYFQTSEKLTGLEKMKYKIYQDGESDHEAVERFITHLREIAVAYSGKTILIASHGGIMRYFLIKLGWASYEELDRHAIKNTAYIKVESDGIDFFINETYQINKAKIQ